MKIIKTNDPALPADQIAKDINDRLSEGKNVLWLVAGGSSMEVACMAANKIEESANLTIMLTDERYGQPVDKDSNEAQLKKMGFPFPIIPVLKGKSQDQTIEEFAKTLEEQINESDFIIALFGVGADGHVAGIMPMSPATVPDEGLAIGYQAQSFYRLTMTPKVFAEIDEAYLWMQGESKKQALKILTETDIRKELQPAQNLKDCGELNIYTDIE